MRIEGVQVIFRPEITGIRGTGDRSIAAALSHRSLCGGPQRWRHGVVAAPIARRRTLPCRLRGSQLLVASAFSTRASVKLGMPGRQAASFDCRIGHRRPARPAMRANEHKHRTAISINSGLGPGKSAILHTSSRSIADLPVDLAALSWRIAVCYTGGRDLCTLARQRNCSR